MARKKRSLIRELQRRKVFKAVASWGGSAGALFGMLEVFGLGVGLSEGVQGLIMGLYILVGLPAAIFFSWTFEEGEDGELDVTDEVDAEQGRGARAGTDSGSGVGWMIASGVLVGGLAVALLDPGGVVTRTLDPYKGIFFRGVTVDDVTGPIVEGGITVEGDIELVLTGAVDPMTASSETVRLLDADGEPVAAPVSVEDSGDRVRIDPRAPLAYGSEYRLVVEGLEGDDGLAVWDADKTGPGAELLFRTQPVPADGVHPRATLAGDFDSERVSAQGPIPVEFDEELDPSTLESGIRLTTQAGEPVDVRLLLSSDSREVSVEPTASLDRGGRYVVVVDSTLLASTGLAATPAELAFRVVPRATVSRPATQTPTPAPARATGPGRLTLTISPAEAADFVRVEVDGSPTALPISGLSLTEEEPHRIVVLGVPDRSSYSIPVFERTVTPTPGQRVTLNAEITPFGSIDVNSEPSGILFIDGREVGPTPVVGYAVPAGVTIDLEIRPTEADAERYDVFTGATRVEPLQWRSLPRIELPPKGAGPGTR